MDKKKSKKDILLSSIQQLRQKLSCWIHSVN